MNNIEINQTIDDYSSDEFGEFGEAAIITMIVEAKQKSQILVEFGFFLNKTLYLMKKNQWQRIFFFMTIPS